MAKVVSQFAVASGTICNVLHRANLMTVRPQQGGRKAKLP
jgi:hypothetical protein